MGPPKTAGTEFEVPLLILDTPGFMARGGEGISMLRLGRVEFFSPPSRAVWLLDNKAEIAAVESTPFDSFPGACLSMGRSGFVGNDALKYLLQEIGNVRNK